MSDIIIIPNIENYTQEIIDGQLVLTPKSMSCPKVETNAPKATTSSVPKLGSRLLNKYDKI